MHWVISYRLHDHPALKIFDPVLGPNSRHKSRRGDVTPGHATLRGLREVFSVSYFGRDENNQLHRLLKGEFLVIHMKSWTI